MKQYAIMFKPATKEQVDSLFRGFFGTYGSDSGFRIVSNDPVFSGSASSMVPYIWGPRKYSAGWLVINNQQKIIAHIKFVDTPGIRQLIFECVDEAEPNLLHIMPEVIKSLERSGFNDVNWEELKIEEPIQNSDNIPDIPGGSVEDKSHPWMTIPDKNWDRRAVQMWWENYDRNEIGRAVGVKSRRVTNRLSELRDRYGIGVVPYDKDRRIRPNK